MTAVTVESALREFASINNLLCDDARNSNVQSSLIAAAFPIPDRLRMFENSKSLATMPIIFHRAACLIAMKLALACADVGTERHHVTAHEIGEITLLVNDFLRKEHEFTDDPELLLEFLANWDLTNPPNIASGYARTNVIIGDIIQSRSPEITTRRDRLGIDLRVFSGGCSLTEVTALSFFLYSVMASSAKEGGTPSYQPATLPDRLKIDKTKISSFLAIHSRTLEQFTSCFSLSTPDQAAFTELLKQDEYLHDMKEFRRTPILNLSPDSHVMLDARFAAELASSGVYWDLLLRYDSNADRSDVAALWGYAFENYCERLLKTEKRFANRLSFQLPYVAGGKKTNIDAMLDNGRTVVLFEFKSSRLRSDQVRSRDIKKAEGEFDRKFTGRRGQSQLARHARAAVSGDIPQLVGRRPLRVFPVLVADDSLLSSVSVNRYIDAKFQKSLGTVQQGLVAPLTVLTIEELEELLPYVSKGRISLEEVFEERFKGGDMSWFSVSQAVFNITSRNHFPKLRNQHLLKRWETVMKEATALIRKDAEVATFVAAGRND
jgi:hypothetical protein